MEPLWDKKRISQANKYKSFKIVKIAFYKIASIYINVILDIDIDIAIEIDNDMNIYNDMEFFLAVIDIDIEFVFGKFQKQHF